MSEAYENDRMDNAYRFHSQVDDDEPLVDVLGQDLLQTYLAAAYAQYMLNSTRNLIGHIYGGSPLVGQRKPLDCSFNDMEAT